MPQLLAFAAMMLRGDRLALAAALVVLATTACNRNVEPYDPNQQVERPDLSKIFPEGAERSGDADVLRGVMPPEAPAAAAGGAPLSGTIRITPELAERVPAGAVLFLIARTGPAGPPTAVRRVPEPSFPLEFSIGPDDRMLAAMPFAGPFQLVARVDADRDAVTRNPGDLQGEADGSFEPGASGIEIVIDEVL
jgi:cytochrome c-type biogenesis protein CcmH